MRVVDKKLTMPIYCVAANSNNSQTTPGITMHELPRNRPAVRRKWINFIQFKRADFLAAPHHAHLCSEHFSECDFANPMEYRFEADMMFRYSLRLDEVPLRCRTKFTHPGRKCPELYDISKRKFYYIFMRSHG